MFNILNITQIAEKSDGLKEQNDKEINHQDN